MAWGRRSAYLADFRCARLYARAHAAHAPGWRRGRCSISRIRRCAAGYARLSNYLLRDVCSIMAVRGHSTRLCLYGALRCARAVPYRASSRRLRTGLRGRKTTYALRPLCRTAAYCLRWTVARSYDAWRMASVLPLSPLPLRLPLLPTMRPSLDSMLCLIPLTRVTT